jgi:hypothetical protein
MCVTYVLSIRLFLKVQFELFVPKLYVPRRTRQYQEKYAVLQYIAYQYISSMRSLIWLKDDLKKYDLNHTYTTNPEFSKYTNHQIPV